VKTQVSAVHLHVGFDSICVDLPELLATAWEQRKGQAEQEKRQLTTRLGEQQALNKQAVEARVKGLITDQDFATLKKAITDEFEQIEHGLKRLEEERNSVRELAKIKEFELKDLAESWQKGDLQYRVDLQFALAPEGLRRSIG
jgi:hypothetical protein